MVLSQFSRGGGREKHKGDEKTCKIGGGESHKEGNGETHNFWDR